MFDMKLIPALLVLALLSACGGSTPPPTPPMPDATQTAFATLTPVPPQPTSTPKPFRSIPVIGYFPDYRQLESTWAEHLTDIIYFSAEPRADGTLDTSRLNEAAWQALQKIRTENGTRLHLSIGGWERGSDFSAMTADEITRHKFVNALTEFALSHNLAGVDFDWEFPKDETEFSNYILLLTETKESFSRYNLLVSVALYPELGFPLKSFAVVDRIHIMSYDRDVKHATYEQAVADFQAFVDAGIPPEKLVLGIPFYGRNTKPPYRVLSYAEIMRRYQPGFQLDEVDGMFYNGIETVQRKTCYALRESAGGVMIWELAHDTLDETSLLQAIFEVSVGRKPC